MAPDQQMLPEGAYSKKEVKQELNKRGRPKLTPFVNPITQINRQISVGGKPKGMTKKQQRESDKLTRGILLDAVDRELSDTNDLNLVIAKAICPRQGKGWAWNKRTGIPIDFRDPSQSNALIGWASLQPWWKMTAPEGDMTFGEHYTEMCITASDEGKNRFEIAHLARDFVANSILKYDKVQYELAASNIPKLPEPGEPAQPVEHAAETPEVRDAA